MKLYFYLLCFLRVPWLTPPTVMPTMHDITEIVVQLVQQEPLTLSEHLFFYARFVVELVLLNLKCYMCNVL